MERRLVIASAAVFGGVMLAGLVVAEPGMLRRFDPVSAFAGSTHAIVGGDDSDDDDEREGHDHEERDHEEREHEERDHDEDDD